MGAAARILSAHNPRRAELLQEEPGCRPHSGAVLTMCYLPWALARMQMRGARLQRSATKGGLGTTEYSRRPRSLRQCEPKRGRTGPPPGRGTMALYFLQKAGVKSTRTLKISSRPRSIAAVQIQVCASVRAANVVAGPTTPRPGPMLLTEAMIAPNDDTKSRPVISIAKVSTAITTKYRNMNPSTES